MTKFINFLLPTIVGCGYFLLICGFALLDISSITWLTNPDQYQIYLSWIFYKNSDWDFPIGLNPNFGIDIPSALAYNASGLAIPFKLIWNSASINYHYLGLWYLSCFILQSFFAYKLIGLVTRSRLIKLISIGFFIFSTPMLNKLNLHILLIPHFFILGALYLSFKPDHQKIKSIYWGMLLVSSVMIHFYIFFIVGFLWVGDIANNYIHKSRDTTLRVCIEIILTVLLVLLAAWQMGYFVMKGMPGGELGFGLYRTHLLSFIDGANWSKLIPAINTSDLPFGDFKLSDGTYEGESYLGLGNIILILIAIYKISFSKVDARKIINKYFFTFLVIAILTLFSLSNNITFLKWNIHIPLPEFILNLGSILRASGRMIWPLFYTVVFFGLIGVITTFTNKKIIIIILSLCLLIQGIDLSYGWHPIREKFQDNNSFPLSTNLKNPIWQKFSNKYKSVIIVPLSHGSIQKNWQTFSYFAALNNMGTNAVYQGRVDLGKVDEANRKYDIALNAGEYDPNTLYIIDDDLVIPASRQLHRKQDLFARIDGFNVLAPGWNTCSSCEEVSQELLISTPIMPPTQLNDPFLFGKGEKGFAYLLGVGKAQQIGWGWDYPEVWGVWSEGRKAKLLIPYPLDVKPQLLLLKSRAFISLAQPDQLVEIWVNEIFQKKIVLKKPDKNLLEIDLPKNTARDYVLIELRFPNAISAKKLGLSDDIRKLAIGLESGVLQ